MQVRTNEIIITLKLEVEGVPGVIEIPIPMPKLPQAIVTQSSVQPPAAKQPRKLRTLKPKVSEPVNTVAEIAKKNDLTLDMYIPLQKPAERVKRKYVRKAQAAPVVNTEAPKKINVDDIILPPMKNGRPKTDKIIQREREILTKMVQMGEFSKKDLCDSYSYSQVNYIADALQNSGKMKEVTREKVTSGPGRARIMYQLN